MPVHVRIHSARRKDLTRFRLKHHSILSTRQSAENCRRNLSLSLSLVPLISPPGWLVISCSSFSVNRNGGEANSIRRVVGTTTTFKLQ
jgi:hypothetical protein